MLIQVVQGIISELESQGALPRSNSRVSSLATCCGPRLVNEDYLQNFLQLLMKELFCSVYFELSFGPFDYIVKHLTR